VQAQVRETLDKGDLQVRSKTWLTRARLIVPIQLLQRDRQNVTQLRGAKDI